MFLVFLSLHFRVGHHSTSDDSSAYRSVEEINEWTTNDYPTGRFRAYLEGKSYWNEEMERQFLEEARKNVLTEFTAGEKRPKPVWTEVFTDVYKDMPPHIRYKPGCYNNCTLKALVPGNNKNT